MGSDKKQPSEIIPISEGCFLIYCSTADLLDDCTEKLDVFSYHYYNGVIFHNTLASSDYGWLKHGSFVPRPSYFAVLLWKRLMGNTVYASGEQIRPGAHVYAHSRADGKEGVAYLAINTSWTETTTVELPKSAEVYALTGKAGMRSRTMLLNGKELVLGENDELPELTGELREDTIDIAPGGCTFIIL